MKPLKLTISAIGPYATTMEPIDFTQFEDKGTFLITGDTGAGKTTIFDSICYALYGEASGSYRGNKNLRSEYASADTPSFVEFTFSHQGKEYTVRREPSYMRKKRRGEGAVEEKENAILHMEDGKTIEGVSPVTAALLEILKLNCKQFKQTAMIAQGEFWELLNASTEKRTEILRTIFETSPYKRMEEEVKQERSKQAEKLKILYHDISTDINALFTEETNLASQLSQIQQRIAENNSSWSEEELMELLDKIISDDEKRQKGLQVQIRQENEKLENLNASLVKAQQNNELLQRKDDLLLKKNELDDKAEEMKAVEKSLSLQKVASHEVKPFYEKKIIAEESLKSTRERIEKTENDLVSMAEEIEIAQKEDQAAKEQLPKANDLELECRGIEKDLPQYEKRESTKLALNQAREHKTKLEQKEKELTEKQQMLQEKTGQLKEQIASRSDMPRKLDALERKLEEIRDAGKNTKKLQEEDLSNYRENFSRLTKAQQNFKEKQRAFEEAEKLRMDGEHLLDHARAGILAKNLQENTACPVCGSIHHPSPATLLDTDITEEEVKLLKEKEGAASLEKNDALTKCEALRSRGEEMWHQLQGKLTDLLNTTIVLDTLQEKNISATYPMEQQEDAAEDIEFLLNNIRTSLKEKGCSVINERTATAKGCQELEDLQKSLEKAEGEESDRLAELQKENQNALQDNIAKIAQLEEAEKGFHALFYPTYQDALAAKEIKEKEYKTLRENADHAAEIYQKLQNRKLTLTSSKDTMTQDVKAQEEKLQQLNEDFEAAYMENGFASSEEFLGYVVSEAEITAKEELIREYHASCRSIQDQLAQALKDAEGKEHINIEELAEKTNAQKASLNDLRSKGEAHHLHMQNNQSAGENIRKRNKELAAAQKKAAMITRLTNLITGQGTGGFKVTLEQYVQATGFDAILAAANRRLGPMSDGQFELFRQETGTSKKTNTYLDLEVQDNYTGHHHPVGNLSGGESFKASLSLALGLSDTVSSNAGGLQVDALFIDEGFGTLDGKSIDNAMNALLDVGESNKLVGIISHREELMEKVPQQICVTKDQKGSHLKIVAE